MRIIMVLGVLLSFLSAEPREALLIGNSNYQYISKLNNPKSDLNRLKSTLESLGFSVKIKTNLNSENLEEAIERFATRLARNKSTTGFLYYTGHGCQVEHRGYLLPIDVNSINKIKVKHHALKIDEMIETLKDSGNRVNMFFLDACRDVPTGTRGSSKGLGQIKNTPKGTLVVYATENGKTAEDNNDFLNSIISSVKEPNQNIRNLPYSISDIFKGTSQTPIFSAVGILKIVLNKKGAYVPPIEPRQPIYVPKPVVVKPKPHSSKSTVTIDGLMYQNQPVTKRYTWEKAKKYCQDLTLDGYSDWRLPNRKELNAIRTKNKIQGQKEKYYIRKEFVQNLRSYAWFWTSTTKDSSSVWFVLFYRGHDDWNFKSNNFYALCVR